MGSRHPLEGAPGGHEYIYPQGIGTEFEAAAAVNADLQLVSARTNHQMALLRTIELADLSALRARVQPDGYVFGAGAGAIFAMAALFPADKPPRAILGCDTAAPVVITGRVAAHAMRFADRYEEFEAGMEDPQAFQAIARLVIASEQHDLTRSIFEQVSLDDLAQDATRLQKPPLAPMPAALAAALPLSVPAVIRDSWHVLKPMADAHNIGFVLGSMYDPAVQNALRNVPSFDSLNNIGYESNLPDYASHYMFAALVGRPGMSLQQVQWLAFRLRMQSLNTPNNTFALASLQNDMKLGVVQGLPEQLPQFLE
ncbi:MAG TPA: hypothetical protein VFT53_04635 [Candidatus Saccharimonadales bacterium]|nr:hypothetical protein [Candidatus Saccharimonadales bacterium]